MLLFGICTRCGGALVIDLCRIGGKLRRYGRCQRCGAIEVGRTKREWLRLIALSLLCACGVWLLAWFWLGR
jgi:hypothetical protein